MILGDPSTSAPKITELLQRQGLRVFHLIPGESLKSIDDTRVAVDLSSPESLRACRQTICDAGGARVGAIINLLALNRPFCQQQIDQSSDPLQLANWTLRCVQEFADDLRASSKDGGGWVLNVTTLDGRFGCADRGKLAVSQASTLGICKTLAREIHGLHAKNLDFDPQFDSEQRQRLIVEEFLLDDSLMEVGHDNSGRWTIHNELANSSQNELSPLPIDRNSVILITGGAGGVTAAVAKELARQASPKLILVGRSTLPQPEETGTRQCRDRGSLRQHLIKEFRQAGKECKPAEIESCVQRILKDREILENIQAMRAAGSNVEYHAVDVRQQEPFAALIRHIYEKHGRLDGVIHGAGIVEDKLIRDKKVESFARVFSTKVDSAITLVNNLRSDSLKFLVFFSSVSARLGAMGQVDYAAANEVLNKLAAHLGATWPGRVVAINWGPWHGGMVSDQLLRQYAARNIPTIGLSDGAARMVKELRRTGKSRPEVVIVAGDLASLAKAAAASENTNPLTIGVQHK